MWGHLLAPDNQDLMPLAVVPNGMAINLPVETVQFSFRGEIQLVACFSSLDRRIDEANNRQKHTGIDTSSPSNFWCQKYRACVGFRLLSIELRMAFGSHIAMPEGSVTCVLVSYLDQIGPRIS